MSCFCTLEAPNDVGKCRVGRSSAHCIATFVALSFTFGITISVFALILEELSLKRFSRAGDLVTLGAVAVLENFGYRQLNNFWRLRGTWQYLRGSQQWGEMKRKGFGGT